LEVDVPLPQEFHDLAKKVNNWGRWGKDDEIGTINLITDDVVRKGAACIRTGKRFALGIPLGQNGPQVGLVPGRINPLRTMVAINDSMTGDTSEFCTSDDIVTMGLQAGTHWDSLAHVSYDNRLYNGFPASSITAHGAAHCGIDKVSVLAGRSVLLDVALAQGHDRLEPGYALRPEDLDAACSLAGLKVEPGDIVLLRTGQMQLLHQGDKLAYAVPNPGPSTMTVEWFHNHDVAAVATDSLTFEVYPCERDDVILPVHLLHLVEMGMTQGQNFDLEVLAADCADDGVYQFFLEASPEPFVAGLGTPVNPVAIK
jgi:kynurenine formamidase